MTGLGLGGKVWGVRVAMAEEGVPPSAGLDLGGMDAQEEEADTGWSPPTTLPHVTNWVRGASVFYAINAMA